MDQIKQFVIQEWHVVALFATILGGIFKSEIVSSLNAVVLIIEQRELTGKTVQILEPDGTWKAVTIISYHYELPFIRTGGVMLHHEDEIGGFVKEKVNFNNWKSLRIRTPLS